MGWFLKLIICCVDDMKCVLLMSVLVCVCVWDDGIVLVKIYLKWLGVFLDLWVYERVVYEIREALTTSAFEYSYCWLFIKVLEMECVVYLMW